MPGEVICSDCGRYESECICSQKPTTEEQAIEQLASRIEVFMAGIPEIPDQNERDWSSMDMATALYGAGYRLQNLLK